MPIQFTNKAISVKTPAQRQAALLRAHMKKIFNREIYVDGLFEGGGALGAAYIGGLRALEDNNFWFKRVVGNSAGAITASMVAVGFSAQEIQWLSSAYPEAGPPDQTLSDKGILSPVRFSEFLDLPTIDSISQSTKRKTILWNILKGTIIDEIGKIEIPIPTQSEAVAGCRTAVMNDPMLGPAIRFMPGTLAETKLEEALNSALTLLPDRKYKISEFLPNTNALRTQFADTLWDIIAKKDPLYLISTNLWHEGSIFEGDKFLSVLRQLFGKKVHNDPNRTVTFNDLNIPLAVIGTDIDTGQMLVYSKKTNQGRFEVAEAVRQSMSIPFIFEPRGSKKQIVDGGLCSNFPLWLFAAGGDQYWDAAVIDHSRLKIGFSLNEKKAAPNNWQTDPPRFNVAGNPPSVNTMQVLMPILAEKIKEILLRMGYPQNIVTSMINASLGNTNTGNNQGQGLDSGPELIQEIVGVVKAVMNTEESTRLAIVKGLTDGVPYIDVPIPLLGYDGLDFYVNEDGDALLAMWDRAWQKTIEGLIAAANRGDLGRLRNISERDSPFKWH